MNGTLFLGKKKDVFHYWGMTTYVHAQTKGPEKRFSDRFFSIVSSFYHFHILMMGALLAQFFAFFILINLAPKSFGIAIDISLFLITIFAYVIFNYYLQTRKPAQLLKLKELYLSGLREEVGDSEDHLSIAKALNRLLSHITSENGYENTFAIPALKEKLSPLLIDKDFYLIQEMLILTMIEEYHKEIKKEPRDLKAHTALSNTYIQLADLYSSRSIPFSIRRQQLTKEFEERYTLAIEMAIEELKILDDYVPNDPWIHANLAKCYHKLKMYDAEIEEYEILKNLCPNDKEILLKLGKLYFSKHASAKAMRIYEKLKALHPPCAKVLIDNYDTQIMKKLELLGL